MFGQEDRTHFNIGAPLELEETQINIDLVRLVERSVGVFGKSGTGKSFLTRMILAGVIKNDVAVNLIFDMHNDYGWEVKDERGTQAKGLRQLLAGPAWRSSPWTTKPRGGAARKPDHVVTLGYDEIEPEDLAMLKTTMDLSDSMIDAAYELQKLWGSHWIGRLIDAGAETLDILREEHFGQPGVGAGAPAACAAF